MAISISTVRGGTACEEKRTCPACGHQHSAIFAAGATGEGKAGGWSQDLAQARAREKMQGQLGKSLDMAVQLGHRCPNCGKYSDADLRSIDAFWTKYVVRECRTNCFFLRFFALGSGLIAIVLFSTLFVGPGSRNLSGQGKLIAGSIGLTLALAGIFMWKYSERIRPVPERFASQRRQANDEGRLKAWLKSWKGSGNVCDDLGEGLDNLTEEQKAYLREVAVQNSGRSGPELQEIIRSGKAALADLSEYYKLLRSEDPWGCLYDPFFNPEAFGSPIRWKASAARN